MGTAEGSRQEPGGEHEAKLAGVGYKCQQAWALDGEQIGDSRSVEGVDDTVYDLMHIRGGPRRSQYPEIISN